MAGDGYTGLIFIAFMIAVFYFMLIRPQKRRVAEHKALVDAVGVGDEVVTIGGLYGTVAAVGEDEIELEVSSGVRLRFVKSAIARRLTEDLTETEDAEAEEDEEV